MRDSKETGILTIAKTLLGKVVPQETISKEASQTEAKLLCKTNSNRVELCSSHTIAFACLALLFIAALPMAFAISEEVFAANLGSNNSTQYLTTSDFNAERWVQITVSKSKT